MNGTGSSSRIFRLARDRRSGREIRDGVIPQHDRSVKSGGQVADPNPPGLGLDLRLAPDRVAAEADHAADQDGPVILHDLDQVGVRPAEPPRMRDSSTGWPMAGRAGHSGRRNRGPSPSAEDLRRQRRVEFPHFVQESSSPPYGVRIVEPGPGRLPSSSSQKRSCLPNTVSTWARSSFGSSSSRMRYQPARPKSFPSPNWVKLVVSEACRYGPPITSTPVAFRGAVSPLNRPRWYGSGMPGRSLPPSS